MKPWAKIREWSRLFSEYAVAQLAVQGLGIGSALLVINFLSVREYALYAFALAVLTFLSVFSDLGLSGALLYFRRETRKSRSSFAPYVAATIAMRRGLTLIGAAIAVPFLYFIGNDRGFDLIQLAAAAAVIVATVWVQLLASVGLVTLRLEEKYRESYLAEFAGNTARLLGVLAMIVTSAFYATIAMLAGFVGALATWSVAGRRLNTQPALERDLRDPGIHRIAGLPYRDLVRYVLPTSVSSAYYAVQAPLVVWLSAAFSGTESIAEVGALGRLGAAAGLVTGFMGAVLFPRLSLVTDDRHYLRRVLQFWIVLIVFGALLVATAAVFPKIFLFLLGSSYSDLAQGLIIAIMTSVLGVWGGYVVTVNNARGWVRPQPALLAIYALIQLALIAALDLRTTMSVLQFGLYSSIAGLLLHGGVSVAGFLRPEWVIVVIDKKHESER